MEQDERVNLIMAYESGDISGQDALRLFSHLIKTGMCWSLQGHYGRTAKDLIDNEIISKKGEILV